MGNGTAIFSFNEIENAKFAASQLNNYMLDKLHTFKAFTMSEYENII